MERVGQKIHGPRPQIAHLFPQPMVHSAQRGNRPVAEVLVKHDAFLRLFAGLIQTISELLLSLQSGVDVQFALRFRSVITPNNNP